MLNKSDGWANSNILIRAAAAIIWNPTVGFIKNVDVHAFYFQDLPSMCENEKERNGL